MTLTLSSVTALGQPNNSYSLAPGYTPGQALLTPLPHRGVLLLTQAAPIF